MFIGSESFSSPLLLSWVGRCCKAARFFPEQIRGKWQALPLAWRDGIVVAGILVAFAFYDALIGGIISGILREDGRWYDHDQRINDAYQLGFSLPVLVLLVSMIVSKSRKQNIFRVVIICLLCLCYIEDTLYYVLLPVASPIMACANFGVSYSGIDFPDSVSGIAGWLLRRVYEEKFVLGQEAWFILNLVGLGICIVLFAWRGKRG